MKKTAIVALVIAAVVAALAVTDWFAYRPDRLASAFVGHLAAERYDEAAAMLRPPSAIEVAPDGGLTVIDHGGSPAAVPKASLPFLSGGGTSNGPGHFSATALQGRTETGAVREPVTLYLSVDGSGTRIESVGQLPRVSARFE